MLVNVEASQIGRAALVKIVWKGLRLRVWWRLGRRGASWRELDQPVPKQK